MVRKRTAQQHYIDVREANRRRDPFPALDEIPPIVIYRLPPKEMSKPNRPSHFFFQVDALAYAAARKPPCTILDYSRDKLEVSRRGGRKKELYLTALFKMCSGGL